MTIYESGLVDEIKKCNRREEMLMSNALVLFMLVCSMLFSGCGRSGRGPQVTAMDKESPVMITIDNFEVTDKTLTIDYRITNNFDEGIWVCYDLCVHGEQGTQDTATRIEDKTAHIKLCFNLGPSGGFENPQGVAKYIRLLPGETCSGRIVEDLPTRDYSREWRAERKEHRDIMLHRAVFEVGYIGAFGPKWDKLLSSWAKKMKEGLIESKPRILGPFYLLPVSPLITNETLDGQLREVMYLQEPSSIMNKEKSTEVLITNVDIPCSVVVDE